MLRGATIKVNHLNWKEIGVVLAVWTGLLVSASAFLFPIHVRTGNYWHPPNFPVVRRRILPQQSRPQRSVQSQNVSSTAKFSRIRDVKSVSRSRFPASFGDEMKSEIDPTREDYLVFDSLHLADKDRPSLPDVLNNPRDILTLTLIAVAAAVSVCNIVGNYSSLYSILEMISVILGLLSGLAGLLQAATGYKINHPSHFGSGKRRRGLADDANVNVYAGLYALTVSWLALRTISFCPSWLMSSDSFLPVIAIGVFVLAVLAPAITLLNPGKILDNAPPLSETELLRMRGLLAIGILASVFAPDCFAFASEGRDWWDRVTFLHPSQQTLESSTSLFALYANEASMVSHRCGRAGVAPFQAIVPSFAAVCFLLAILPCFTALYWLGNDVSFFSFYGE
jgi:hypothetical protein